ncbi:MAG TPA: helix-turn-helix domain-containing protein [Novosphingobium sp.]|nr:helix-turn-helix domain-containing protein [Novosphingobium sp.]
MAKVQRREEPDVEGADEPGVRLEGRLSQPVKRMVSILNFFLEHPQQSFTLTQTAKSLHLSRATTHSILLSFVEAGYLYRRPDKSYVLGLALPRLAANALQKQSPLLVASQEMRALADELDVIVSALFPEGDTLIVRERAASVNHIDFTSRQHHAHYPMRTAGNIFRALLSDAELGPSLAGTTPPLPAELQAVFHGEIRFVRKHGFLVSVIENPAEYGLGFRATAVSLPEIDPEAVYRLHHFVAPVLDGSGGVAFALSMFGFKDSHSGEDAIAIGRSLRRTCDRISAYISGMRA